MLDKIIQILNDANPNYKVIYEEAHMMNVKVDDLNRQDSFIYIEEFTQGQIVIERYRRIEKMRAQIYFSKFANMHGRAIRREELRSQIKAEAMYPFINAYENVFGSKAVWNIYYPFPRWDGNEVSVMLEFDYESEIC